MTRHQEEEEVFEPVNGVATFFKSLDWSEPWLYALASAYAVLYAGVYLSRRNSAVQIFTFVFLVYLMPNTDRVTRLKYYQRALNELNLSKRKYNLDNLLMILLC